MAHFIKITRGWRKNRTTTIVNADHILFFGKDAFGPYAKLTNDDDIRGLPDKLDAEDECSLNPTVWVPAEPGFGCVTVNRLGGDEEDGDEEGGDEKELLLTYHPVVAWRINPAEPTDAVPATASGCFSAPPDGIDYHAIIRPDGFVVDREGGIFAGLDEWLIGYAGKDLTTHKVTFIGMPENVAATLKPLTGRKGDARHASVEKPAKGYRPTKGVDKDAEKGGDAAAPAWI